MLILLLLKRGELLVLIGLPARCAVFGRQHLQPLEKLLVVEARVHPCAGKNHQPTAAAQVALHRLHRGVGEVRHVRQHHRVVVIEPRLRKLRRRDGDGLDEILCGGFRRHRHQCVLEEEHFAVARFVSRLAVHQQDFHFLNGPQRDGAPVVGG